MVDVALFAARVSPLADVTMTSTRSRTKSVTSPGKRSGLPAAKALLRTRLRPST
jgi:hypothetical protein